MAQLVVYDAKAKKVGDMEVSDKVFATRVRQNLLHEVVTAQLASRRSGTANTKTRAEVNRSSRKLYRQKGTGRARAGSAGSPIFKGGGVAHGPKPRDFSYKPPKKVRAGALRSALSLKAQEGLLTVVDGIKLDEVKTKTLVGLLAGHGIGASLADQTALIVVAEDDRNLKLSARNLPFAKVLRVDGINVYDMLRFQKLILTKAAVEELNQRLGGN